MLARFTRLPSSRLIRPRPSCWVKRAAASISTTSTSHDHGTPTAPPLDPSTVQDVLSSATSSPSIHHTPNVLFDIVQTALEAFHTFTGLPWYLTIIGSTILVRSSFLPLIIYQMRVATNYAITAKPESDRLWSLVQKATPAATTNIQVRMEAYQIYVQGMRSVLNKYRISLLSMFGGTLIQIPTFITFVLTMRRMIRDPVLANDLSTGGTLWFENLTLPDSTMMLPLAAIGLTYVNLQVSLGNAPKGSMFLLLKDVGQVLLILGLPLTSGLPQGVFVYWTASAGYSAVQTQVLRADGVRALLGLPPVPTKGGGAMPTPRSRFS